MAFKPNLEARFVALLTALDGSNTIGLVEFESEEDDNELELELELEVEGAAAGTYDVTVSGVVIGQITIDENGEGELHASNDPDDEGEI